MKKIIVLLLMGWYNSGYTKEFSPLMQAVQNQDTAKAVQLIKEGADVNFEGADVNFHTGEEFVDGKTALMIAAGKGNVPLMELLIQAGADVNAHEGWDQPHAGKPVLRYAIDSGNLEAVNLLLKNGAKVNTFTECPVIHQIRGQANVRNIPLLSCAINSHAPIEIIEALIKIGKADVNKKSMIGDWTPLMIAALKGYIAAVEALLAAGADKTLKNKIDENRTALDYAQEGKHQKIIDLLNKPAEQKQSSWWENILSWFGIK